MGDKRTDSGQFYPGGKVIPRQPVRPGGGGDMNHSEFADLEGKENMTQKESNRLLNTIVRKLKGVSALAVSAFGLTYLVLTSSAALGPETDFGDISPTNKLKEVVEASGAISGVDTNTVAALANIAIATNALTVTATNDIATLQTSKRDKTNLEVETYVPATDWEITYNPSGWSGNWRAVWDIDPHGTELYGWLIVTDNYVSHILSTDPDAVSITDTDYFAWNPGFGVGRTLAHIERDRIATTNAVSIKRDLTNNVCAVTMFSRFTWTSDEAPAWWLEEANADGGVQPMYIGGNVGWNCPNIGGFTDVAHPLAPKNSVSIEFLFVDFESEAEFHATAVRFAVCASNELCVTQSYVTNFVNAATKDAVKSSTVTNIINAKVSANLNTYIDGETGVEYRGVMYGKSFYYVPTGNVYPPNN